MSALQHGARHERRRKQHREENSLPTGREELVRTRLATLATLPLHDANVHVAHRRRFRLHRLLERIPHVRRTQVSVLQVRHADILPGGHGSLPAHSKGKGAGCEWRAGRRSSRPSTHAASTPPVPAQPWAEGAPAERKSRALCSAMPR